MLQNFTRIGVVALVTSFVGWYCYARSQVPDLATVNGIFSNDCCGEIVLRNGVIITNGDHVRFKLENMKFGLTAYTEKRLEVHGSEIVSTENKEENLLSFENDGKALTLCGDRLCRTTYFFVRR